MDYEWIISASKGEIVFSVILSLAYTVALYGTGPLLFCRFNKKAITSKRLILFSTAYTFLAWLLSNMLQVFIFNGEISNGGAAFLWGWIFYFSSKRHLFKKGLLGTSSVTVSAENAGAPEERWYTCQKCGQLVREGENCDCEQAAVSPEKQPEFKEKRDWRRVMPYIGCILLAVFFAVSLFTTIYGHWERDICGRCGGDKEVTEICPCCSAPICKGCLADIEYEHSELEKAGYNSGFEEGANAGYEDGYKDGMADGYAEGCYDSIHR